MLTFGCGEYLRWMSVFACLVCFSSMNQGDFRCPTAADDIFQGIIVDCSSKGLQPLDLPVLHIPVKNTTSLLLDYNSLQRIINGSFSRLRKLRRLQINLSGITYLELDAFEGLAGLRILSLSNNHLDIAGHAFPFGVFRHIRWLKELNIAVNHIKIGSGNYTDFIDIFQYLSVLNILYISSFPTLYIGKEFEKLGMLRGLYVDGASQLIIISNNSLEGLQHSNITDFGLSIAKPYEFGTGVFKSLPHTVSSLTLNRVSVGNINLLKALEPLRGRKIPVIYFSEVTVSDKANPPMQVNDGVLDYENLKHLLNICVLNLTWKNSNLFALDVGFSSNSTLGRCIKSIDVSDNQLQLYRIYFIRGFASMEVLEEVRVSVYWLPKHTVSFWDDNNQNLMKTISQEESQGLGFQTDTSVISLTKRSTLNCSLPPMPSRSTLYNDYTEEKDGGYLLQKTLLNERYKFEEGVNFSPPKIDPQYSSLSSRSSNLSFIDATIARRNRNGCIRIFLPKHLRYLNFDKTFGLKTSDALTFAAPNNLTECYYRYARTSIRVKYPFLVGLNNLRLIDFTGTFLEEIPLTFFDSLPSLQVLVLSQTQKDPGFLQLYGRRLIKNIANLVYLDLSNNGLNVLPEGIFRENRLLRYLCLARNRFSSIPFQFRLTPSLEKLDMRMNAICSLEKGEEVIIDEHLTMLGRKNFTLFLEGNNVLCTCSDLLLTAWVRRTRVQFDLDGRLTCLAEDGNSLNIEFLDVEQLWRTCHGRYVLLLSLLFLFAMIVLYLAAFVISMYQTYIIGKLKQMFVPEFQRQTRHDFTHDVFIGYADQECAFVRFHLLRYLEGDLKLKTFVHQRDLRQDLLDVGTALKDSWRTLLIITEAFLAHDMCECIMKTATFFECPSKPDSIIVMVTQDLLYAIPDYVLRVVKDENIIVLPDLETPFSYETTETLRTRILY